MIRRSMWLALPMFLAAGCTVQTDLGVPCVLVKRDATDPTGKRRIALTEGEIGAAQDFLSFGVTECENQVCVRDAAFKRPDSATDATPASGYCSAPCVEGSSIGCQPANAADSKDAALKLSCRPLLLDKETLAAIKTADPDTFTKYFGNTTAPDFCARGAVTEGT